MKRSHLFASLLATTALAAGSVFAQQAPQSPPSPQPMPQPSVAPGAAGNDSGAPSFGDLDKDSHGYLTRSDLPKDVPALKMLRAHFSEADLDHNGRLNNSEYAAYVNPAPVQQQR
jgi:hypothetical protein